MGDLVTSLAVLGLAIIIALQARTMRVLIEAVRALTRAQIDLTAEWGRQRQDGATDG